MSSSNTSKPDNLGNFKNPGDMSTRTTAMNTVNTTCSNTGGGPGARSANQHAMSVTTMISPSRISPIDFNLFTSEEWDRFFEASEGFKYSPTVTISRLSPCFGGGSSANTPTTGTQDPTKEYALLRTLPVNESAEFARVEKLVQAEKEIEALKEQNIALQNRVANLEREVTVDITLQSRVANLEREVTQVTVWSQNLQTYLGDFSSWARDTVGEVISRTSNDWVMDGEAE